MSVARKHRQDALPQTQETEVPVETSQFHVPNERHQAVRERDSSKPTILIVEDEAGPREALKLILRPFYNLHSVDSAEAALQLLKEQAIDLVTLDLKLPGKQGAELLQDIKRDYEHVEVIVITGYGSLKSAMDGLRYGASGYLLKPFNVTELIAIINQSLEKKRRLEGLRGALKQFEDAWQGRHDASSPWKAGSGYPDGLKGDAIPYLARLVGLANAFDELYGERPGNAPLPLEAAKEYIRRQAGILFDPSMVKEFLKDGR